MTLTDTEHELRVGEGAETESKINEALTMLNPSPFKRPSDRTLIPVQRQSADPKNVRGSESASGCVRQHPAHY